MYVDKVERSGDYSCRVFYGDDLATRMVSQLGDSRAGDISVRTQIHRPYGTNTEKRTRETHHPHRRLYKCISVCD